MRDGRVVDRTATYGTAACGTDADATVADVTDADAADGTAANATDRTAADSTAADVRRPPSRTQRHCCGRVADLTYADPAGGMSEASAWAQRRVTVADVTDKDDADGTAG